MTDNKDDILQKSKYYSYCIKLTAALATVSLPFPISNTTKLKIKQLRYVTASSNQEMMIIKIMGWVDNNFYFDGSNLRDYTRIVQLPPTLGSVILYENLNSEMWDVVKKSSVSYINNFRVEVLIDGTYSTDISVSNPLYLEFVLE